MADNKAFHSVFSDYIIDHIKEKRSMGYKYETSEDILHRFDTYCVEKNITKPELSRQLVNEWCEAKDGEALSSRNRRLRTMRQLAEYMITIGEDAYIPNYGAKDEVILPHILTSEERKALFHEIDVYMPTRRIKSHIRLAQEYKVLYRVIYLCGLRNSEACHLKTCEVNLDDSVMTITNSKGNKSRLVYMSDDLVSLCKTYLCYLRDELGYIPVWFFPAGNPENPLTIHCVGNVFTRFWNLTPFKGSKNKPTVHDLRFSFITDRINAWALEGIDVDSIMPYLSEYVGHEKIEYTYYYYHIAKEMAKGIHMKRDGKNSAIKGVDNYG